MTTYNYAPDIHDQGQEGACTAFATCYEVRHMLNQLNIPYTRLGEQFQYNQSRTVLGNFDTDNGVTPAVAFQSAHDYGIAPDSDLPYGPANLYAHPTPQMLSDAANMRITGTSELNIYQGSQYVATDINTALQHGQGVLVSLTLRSGIFSETAANMTYDDTTPVVGGHMWVCDKVLFNSYGVATALDFTSSWGTAIGNEGHFQMTPDQLVLGKTDTGLSVLKDVSTINGLVVNGQTFDVQWTANRTAMSYDYLIFNRSADKSGLFYWAQALDAGMTQPQVLDYLIRSAEGQALYAAENNTQFVGNLYQSLLGRAGDSAGVNWWAGLLNNESRGQLASDFINFVQSSSNTDHDALFNRSLVAGNGGITYQDSGSNHNAEVAALVGVTNDYATVDSALHTLHVALYGV